MAARGIDVHHVGLVVNYEPPETTDLLTHRMAAPGGWARTAQPRPQRMS